MEKNIKNKDIEKKDYIWDKESSSKKAALDENDLEGVTGGTDPLTLIKTIKDVIIK